MKNVQGDGAVVQPKLSVVKNTGFEISVIIPIYNVEEYLVDCLENTIGLKGGFCV